MYTDGPRPPAAWAPAVLASHVVLLLLLAVVSAFLWNAGVHGAGHGTGVATALPPASWTVGVLTVVLVIRAVGRRHPGRLAHWFAGTACWVVVPLT